MTVREKSDLPRTQIDARTAVGTVRLTVRDLQRSSNFYEALLGMAATVIDERAVAFTAAPERVLVELHESPSAAERDPALPGLFHLALLYPSRRDLAVALVRLASHDWPLSGAADHLVSEALYLHDPEGNGIELYVDRPRDSWPYTRGGEVEMDTLPLDLDDLVGELEFERLQTDGRDRRIAPGTHIGHVHLQVSSLPEVEEFYAGLLGFNVTSRWRQQALFLAAGGYHHHIGLNTWNSRGASAPPQGGAGLRSFDLLLPDRRSLDIVLQRISRAGLELCEQDGGTLVRDPSGNPLVLRTA